MSDVPNPDEAKPRSPHHVLDELKNVLSNLGQNETSASVPERKPSAPDPIFSEPAPAAKPPVVPPAPPVVPPPPPASSSANAASDADFWSGNVLGWPTGPQEPKKENPPPSPMPPIGDPASDPFFLAPAKPPAPEPVAIRPVAPPAAAPETFIPEPPPAPVKGDRPPWPTDDFLPEPPPAPASPPKLEIPIPKAEAPKLPEPHEPIFVNPLEMPLDKNFVPSPPPPPLAIPRPETPSTPMESMPFPLPRTVDSEEPKEEIAAADEEPGRPANLVQLACLFPEGQEKIGQRFAKLLRERGAQQVPPFTLEPVLISSWSDKDVDLNAWTKSAELSGADVMFVLAARQDLGMFQSNALHNLTSSVKTRFVAMDHVPLRTLYADILIELKRSA